MNIHKSLIYKTHLYSHHDCLVCSHVYFGWVELYASIEELYIWGLVGRVGANPLPSPISTPGTLSIN